MLGITFCAKLPLFPNHITIFVDHYHALISQFQVLPTGIIEMSVFKLYLSRILGAWEKTDPVSGPLCYYKDKFRSLVGKVLMQSNGLGQSSRYVPLFYQCGLHNASKIFTMVKTVF